MYKGVFIPARSFRFTETGSAWRVLASAVFLSCLGAAALAQSNDVGKINHVRIIVHDVQASHDLYSNVLGFNFPGPPHVFPEGSIFQGTWLPDFTYLELKGVADREKLLKARPWIVEFLEKYEGAHSVGFQVTSAKELANRLAAHDIEAPLSELATWRPGVKPTVNVTPKLQHLPEGVIFFTEYPPPTKPRPELPPEPNASETVRAAWIVVKDLDKAASDLQALGFRHVRSFHSDTLDARGQEFAAVRGSIVLLHASGQGPASQFASKRGEGVMGVTLTVLDLSKTRALIEKNANRTFSTYHGLYGNSFLIPAELARGVWIEFVEEKP